MKLAAVAVQPQGRTFVKDLEFIPPRCIAGSFPGWEFRFSLGGGSAITPKDVETIARVLFPGILDEFIQTHDGRITVKIIGTVWFPKPAGLDPFHALLRSF